MSAGPQHPVPSPLPVPRMPPEQPPLTVQVPSWLVVRFPLVLATLVLALIAVPRIVLALTSIVREYPGAGAITLVVWTLYALPLLALILTVDYFEREPWTLVVFALFWGGFVATGLALSGNDAIQSIVTTAAGPDTAARWGAALAGPTTEEVLKALGVVTAALLARRRMRSPVDGFVIGAVVGLGFQVVEDVVYTGNALALGDAAGSPGQVVWQMFVIRGLYAGLWSHAAYTGLFGLGLGYALTRPNWTPSRRVLAAVLGFGAAWGLHFLWNSPLLVEDIGWELVVVKGLPTTSSLLVLLRRAQRADSAVFLPALAGAPGWATPQEVADLADRRSRKLARRQARRTGGRAAGRAVRALQRAQADLAVASTTGDTRGGDLARAAVLSARSRPGAPGSGVQGRGLVGERLGTCSVGLAVAGFVVPLLALLAVVLATGGLIRAGTVEETASRRLWWALGLGLIVFALGMAVTPTG